MSVKTLFIAHDIWTHLQDMCTKPLCLSFEDQLQEMMAVYYSSFLMARSPCVVDPNKDSGKK